MRIASNLVVSANITRPNLRQSSSGGRDLVFRRTQSLEVINNYATLDIRCAKAQFLRTLIGSAQGAPVYPEPWGGYYLRFYRHFIQMLWYRVGNLDHRKQQCLCGAKPWSPVRKSCVLLGNFGHFGWDLEKMLFPFFCGDIFPFCLSLSLRYHYSPLYQEYWRQFQQPWGC
jgi:hypothetical protein